jgi:isoleucyl-tRNA synthetase
LGTGIGAREAMEKWGADVLRLWIASVEFSDDVRFGPNVVEQIGNVYRNLRNRIRFMLSNVGDLPAAEVVPLDAMQPLDRLACRVTDAFAAEIKAAYERYDLHDAYLRVVEFESTMSSLYFDAVKDPLYSRAVADPRRRSVQSALLYVLKRFLTALAPVLSFTAEEAWQTLTPEQRADVESVFDSSFLTGPHKLDDFEADLALWETLRALRARVAASESPRDFEAQVRLTAAPSLHRRLAALGDTLREALVVSQLSLEQAEGDGVIRFELSSAGGRKCERCWKFRELGVDPAHPAICAECAAVVNALPATPNP